MSHMKGSVRSLPDNKMRDIRRMFEETCENSTTSTSLAEEGNESHVKATLGKFEQKEDMANGSPTQRWRQHISTPDRTVNTDMSPTRKPRRNVSPSVKPDTDIVTPKPTPRKTLAPNINYNSKPSPEHGLAGLRVQQFGQIAGGLAFGEATSEENRVSKLVGKLDAVTITDTETKKPSVTKSEHPDTQNKSSPAHRKTSNAALESNSSDETSKNPVYSKLWESNNVQTKPNSHLLNVKTTEKEKRPVSVFERLQMFEQNTPASSTSSPTPVKPSKPPPPSRQRSWSADHRTKENQEENNSTSKVPPKRPIPPMRQRSLVEKRSVSIDEEKETLNLEQTEKSVNISPSMPRKVPMNPPVKPPRTGAHDDYLKVKLDQTSGNRVTLIDEDSSKLSCKSEGETKDINVSVKPSKSKPLRPPPPKKKPRPFSVSVDNSDFDKSWSGSSTEAEDFSKLDGDNPFYEVIAFGEAGSKTSNDPIKHWDLPRISHPEPIKRSLSDDCIRRAVDTEGNVIYMEPDQLGQRGIGGGSGYDIYVDQEGYAVPDKYVKRTLSNNEDDLSDDEPSKPIGDRVKSKFRRFKNIFSDQDKPIDRGRTKGSVRQNDRDAIRQKVNQAFEVLKGSWRRRESNQDSESEEDTDEQEDTPSSDTDSKVDEREIRKRVEYSRSVRVKTQKNISESKKYAEKKYPQLFEYAMIVGLELSTDTGIYEPVVKYKFPEIKDSNVSVPLFCFPDAANFKPSSSKSKGQSYNFVLTNFDGGRVYGYCRRLVPPKSPNKIPEVICIISPVDAFSMYNMILAEVEKKRRISMDAAQELIAAAFGRPLPSVGQTEIIRTLDEEGEMETIFLCRGTDNRVENINCECLLAHLGSDKLLKVFASILLERSVLFCAKQLSTLSSTIHAITSLLYPFSWQHTFIPVLPGTMIDVVCSPSPYIIGITSSLLSKVQTLPLDDHVLVIDVDKRSFILSQGDEGTLLPRLLEKALKTSLNMCRIDQEAKMFPSLMISEAFLRFFVETVGHYGQHIITQTDGRKKFLKEDFVNGVSSTSLHQLLEWFVETQMFEVFVSTQVEKNDWGNTIEYFQGRVQEHKFTSGRQFKRKLAKKLS